MRFGLLAVRLVLTPLMRGFKGDTSPLKENQRFIFATRLALFGGNCNNGTNCGSRYLNLNNATSNTNWNIGGSQCLTSVQSLWLSKLKQAHITIFSINYRLNAKINRYLLVKIKTLREWLSSIVEMPLVVKQVEECV